MAQLGVGPRTGQGDQLALQQGCDLRTEYDEQNTCNAGRLCRDDSTVAGSLWRALALLRIQEVVVLPMTSCTPARWWLEALFDSRNRWAYNHRHHPGPGAALQECLSWSARQ